MLWENAIMIEIQAGTLSTTDYALVLCLTVTAYARTAKVVPPTSRTGGFTHSQMQHAAQVRFRAFRTFLHWLHMFRRRPQPAYYCRPAHKQIAHEVSTVLQLQSTFERIVPKPVCSPSAVRK